MKKLAILQALFCTFIFASLSIAQKKADSRVELAKGVFIEKIADGIWRHVSYHDFAGSGPVPSNGLIAKSGNKVLLIDSAWNDAQTRLILDWIEKNLGSKPSYAVITHFHEDRMGGIHEIHRRAIPTISTKLTVELAREHGFEPPQRQFEGSTHIKFGDQSVRVEYSGAGHTRDNAVVWFPKQKLLFGGCLVKSATASDLGNTADADLKAWPITVKRLYDQFTDAQIVVPGHGDIAGRNALEHTLELLAAKDK
jgi:metallo-beta-lactamase class B